MIKQENLPDQWRLEDFEDVVEIHDNRREPISSDEREKRIDGLDRSETYPYYGAGGQIGWIDDYIFDDEYILVAEDGATTGYTYRIAGKAWVSNHAHVLKANGTDLSDDFLFYFLKDYNFDPLKTGGTRPKLTQRNLKKVKVPVPPEDEQKSIIEKVEDRLSTLERLEQGVRSISQLTNEYENSLVSFLTLGKELDEQSSIGSIPQEEDLPDSWETVQLSEIASVNPRISYSEQVDYAYVPMDAVSADSKVITRYERRDSLYSGLSKFTEGDIIVARITPCFENGKLAVASDIPDGYEFAVGSTEFVVIRPTDINTEYLFSYLSSPIVYQWGKQRLLGATGRERIKISQFRDELIVPVPPENTQKKIVENIKSTNFDNIRSSIETVQNRIGEYEKSVISHGVQGKLANQ